MAQVSSGFYGESTRRNRGDVDALKRKEKSDKVSKRETIRRNNVRRDKDGSKG